MMEHVIKDYLGQLKTGRKQSFKNLSIFPLLSTYRLGLEYLLLDEALTEGVTEVVELDTEGSGYGSPEKESLARAKGAAAYIRKPFKFEELTGVISTFLK